MKELIMVVMVFVEFVLKELNHMKNSIQENISFVDVYAEEVTIMEEDQYMHSRELFPMT
jgi:hypothetical protein